MNRVWALVLTVVSMAANVSVQAQDAGALPASCNALAKVLQAQRVVEQAGRVIDDATVAVPDRIPREWRTTAFRLRYRLDLGACANGAAPRAILFYRVGAPYDVMADGVPLQPLRQGGFDKPPFNGRIGGMFMLPAGAKFIDIQLATLPNVSGGLIEIAVGPEADLLAGPGHLHQRWQQMTLVISVVLGMAGVLGLLVALRRRLDPQVLWFALACLVWTVRGQLLQRFGSLGDPLLFEQLNPLLILTDAALVSASTLSLAGAMTKRRGILLVAMPIAAIAAFAAVVAWPALAGPLRSIQFVASFSTLIALMTLLAARARSMRPGYAAWLIAGYFCVLVGGGHDFVMILGLLPAGWWTLLTPAYAVLLLCHMVVVGMYLLQTLRRAEQANEELEGAIAARVLELQDSYATQQALELEHATHTARAAERERLLRDMHDGLGAQLMTALRGVERGALTSSQLAGSLQESLDELRLLMDTTDMDDYLPAVLAAWRNRWDARLSAAGVTLNWHLDPSVEDARLTGDSTLQVMRIMQESSVNVVKHARASRMSVRATVIDEPSPALQITITDDGVGLPPVRPGPGRGLSNMAHRAQQMNATLSIDAGEGGRGTRVNLLVPVEMAPQAGPQADQATSPRRAASTAASARDVIPSLR